MSTKERNPARGMNAALSRVLRGEVRSASLSYEDLAELVGVSKSTVNRILKDPPSRHIDAALAYAICSVIGLDPVEAWRRAAARSASDPTPSVVGGLDAFERGAGEATDERPAERDEGDSAVTGDAGRR